MGQKTNPKLFRLITTQNYLSQWYTNKKNYSIYIKEDFFLRKIIYKLYKQYFNISDIKINRFSLNDINITILILYPRYKNFFVFISNIFKKHIFIKNKFFLSFYIKKITLNFLKKLIIKNYKINFKLIKNIYSDSQLITKYISDQLKQRIPYKRIINQILYKIKFINILGIKIQLAGRLNGIEIARTEWKREGKIPLHTLNIKIDYTKLSVKTIYGIIGIKIWLFKK